MPSKWDKFRDKLEPFQLEQSYQEKVDEAKQQYANLSPAELARSFKIVSDQKEDHEREIKELNIELAAISQLGVSILQGSGLQSIEMESGMKCGLRTDVYVSITDTEEARAAYDKWIHSKKMKPLLTLNAQVRNGYVKEQMVAGLPTPPWAKVFLKTDLKLTGRRNESQPGGNGDE